MPVGVMTVQPFIMPLTAAVGALALFGAVMAIRWGGWAGWLLGILAVLVALAGLGFFGFGLWGRYAGFPWGFGG